MIVETLLRMHDHTTHTHTTHNAHKTHGAPHTSHLLLIYIQALTCGGGSDDLSWTVHSHPVFVGGVDKDAVASQSLQARDDVAGAHAGVRGCRHAPLKDCRAIQCLPSHLQRGHTTDNTTSHCSHKRPLQTMNE